MFSKFKTDMQIIFLDPDVDIEPQKAKTAYILSPALYWVRAFELPLRNQKEALKLLPSLFEEFLPSGDFSYFGYFEDERYIGFAYEEEKIRSFLAQKGVDLADAEAFYFAQSELSEDALPLKLNEDWMLTAIDGIVVKLPLMNEAELKPLDLDSLQLSSKSVKIERYTTVIDKKRLYTLCAIFLLFAFAYALEWYKTNQEVSRVKKRSSELFAKYSLLPTMTQNRSVLKKYEKIDKRQKKLRKIVAVLLKISQLEGGGLQSIHVEKNRIYATFTKLKRQELIQKRLRSFDPQIKKLKNGKIGVEVAL